METDKEFFRIFKTNPELFRDFLGIRTKGPCTLKSETLKSLERRVDGVLEFPDRDPVVFIEIQGYRDDAVYQRLVAAMALFHIEHPLRLVQGVILFLKPEYDPRTYPWKSFANSGQRSFRVLYLEEILASLAERDPDHVLLSVFTPLTCRDNTELKRTAGDHYRRLKAAAVEPEGKAGLLEAFESWLIARFRNRAEVNQMIVDIPPIEKSAAARYFRQQGREIGKKLGEKLGKKLGEKLGEKRGEKRGEMRGEMRSLRQQIGNLKKLRKSMSPEVFQALLTPLEMRLAELREEK